MTKRVFVQLITLVTMLVLLCVLIGFGSVYFALADSFAHFRLHFSILLLISAVFFILIRHYKLSTIVFSGAILGILGLGPAMPKYLNSSSHIEADTIKLIQLNLSFRNRSLKDVAAYIKRQRPDFITIQEATKRTGKLFDQLKQKYKYLLLCEFSAVGGVAIISKHPMQLGDHKSCQSKEGLVWGRAAIKGHEVIVASLHLHWPYPFRQKQQLRRLSLQFKKFSNSVIIAGDFNAAPWSHTVQTVSKESKTTVIPGLRFTFEKKFLSFLPVMTLPIDHILTSKDITTKNISVGPHLGSDHFPVVAELSLNQY